MEVLQYGEGGVGSAATCDVLSQFVGVVCMFRAMTVRCLHGGAKVGVFACIRLGDLVIRFFLQGSFLHRYVKVNGGTRALFSFLRATRRLNAWCLVNYVLLAVLSNATGEEERGGRLLSSRRLYRIVVGVANFLRVTRGGRGEEQAFLCRH